MIWIAVIILVLFCVIVIMLRNLHVFPMPTGQHGVGMMEYDLVDVNRAEANNTAARRELRLHIWYPTDVKASKAETLYDRDAIENMQAFIHKKSGVPRWLLSGLQLTRIHAVPDAKIAVNNGQLFPVIIVSHGAGAMMQHYQWFCQELASHGYVVIGISHPYMATTRFSDGRLVHSILNQKRAAGKQAYKAWKREQFEVAVHDVQFVLDCIAEFNQQPRSLFYQKLDLDRIGMCGHSMAGSLAMRMCIEDKRIKAGVAFDSNTKGNDDLTAFGAPFLVITAENSHVWADQEGVIDHEKLVTLCNKPGMNMTIMMIKGIGHGVFFDLPLLLHQTFMTRLLSGYMDVDMGSSLGRARKTQSIANRYMVHFFNTHLKNMSSNLFQHASCDTVIDID